MTGIFYNAEPDWTEPMHFTVVTPSYNYSKYVLECLESVRMQTGVTLEHLVYDAGSTDGTLDILHTWAANHPDTDAYRFRLVVEPDKGMSDAINKGFRAATGDWVMWLNTDDRFVPNALRDVLAFMNAHPEADVVHGAWNFIDADGKFLRRMKAIPYVKFLFIGYGCYIASTATFYRRSTTIEQGHLLNIAFRYVMDGEYFVRLGNEGKRFAPFNHTLADFRLHNASLSQHALHGGDINDRLLHAKREAEDTAIRRAYGWSPFHSSRWNLAYDAIFHTVCVAIRIGLKLLTRNR